MRAAPTVHPRDTGVAAQFDPTVRRGVAAHVVHVVVIRAVRAAHVVHRISDAVPAIIAVRMRFEIAQHLLLLECADAAAGFHPDQRGHGRRLQHLLFVFKGGGSRFVTAFFCSKTAFRLPPLSLDLRLDRSRLRQLLI